MYAEAVRPTYTPTDHVGAASQVRPSGPTPPSQPHRFDAGDLYGKGGPSPSDIQQNNFGDCYFVATLAAVAQQQPQRIQNAISYDANTGNFTVRLHDSSGRAQSIQVTQAEVADNIARGGGSTADNTRTDQRVWPDVMEAAYAKMLDTNHADGLNQGYQELANGGYPQDAMQAITGDRGTEIRHSDGWLESQNTALDRTANQVQAALSNNRPVTLWSVPENRSLWDRVTGGEGRQDGLVDNHVYSVEGIAKDRNGEWQVTVRNPWATNSGVEGGTTAGATLTVPLRTLVDTGGLQAFTAGPAN